MPQKLLTAISVKATHAKTRATLPVAKTRVPEIIRHATNSRSPNSPYHESKNTKRLVVLHVQEPRVTPQSSPLPELPIARQ